MALTFIEKAWSEANQRRKPNGQFDGSTGAGGGGGSAGAVLSTDDQEGADNIQSFLKLTSSLHEPPKGYATSHDRMLLEHGQAFPTNADTYKGKRGTKHHCYENSAKKAFADSSLTYVEGYMTVHGIPLEHAWVVDKKGYVIDPTITAGGVKGYFGIPMTTEFVRDTGLRTGYWGILSNQTNRQLFRDGLPSNAPDVGHAPHSNPSS